MFTGQVWGAVAGTAGTVAMEALGRAAGCYNNPDAAPGFGPTPSDGAGCKKVAPGGLMDLYVYTTSNPSGSKLLAPIVEVGDTYVEDGKIVLPYRGPGSDVFNGSVAYTAEEWLSPKWQTILLEDSTCEVPAPGPQFPDWQPDTPIGPTYEYYDEETGCTWQIKPYDVYLNSAGEPVFHWKATSDDPIACGGPYEWWGNGQEPDIPNFPDPREDDDRPTPPPIPPGPGDDLKDRLDRIEEQLEELKKCACPEKPELARHWRSIRFDSETYTPRGNRRLNKLFRYRGINPGVVDAVADHWKDFRWTTGPVCVKHEGSPLGSPQVWATSIDEGKRVIRHAGREAGIDPDQIGEWGVSGSDNPRYGVSLEVGLTCVDGCWSATSRSGPDGWPEAAIV